MVVSVMDSDDSKCTLSNTIVYWKKMNVYNVQCAIYRIIQSCTYVYSLFIHYSSLVGFVMICNTIKVIEALCITQVIKFLLMDHVSLDLVPCFFTFCCGD